jgi:pimeloyl-ACP methyl ester carboxylesterase
MPVETPAAEEPRIAGEQQPVWRGHLIAEQRWVLESWLLGIDPVFLRLNGVPRGDGRPVVLLPGFMAGDYTLNALRLWLRRLGYRPSTAGFLTNTDCSARGYERAARAVDRAVAKHGRRVAVIGHSRGGHYARALAAARPEQVSHAISLGADLQGMLGISQPTLRAVGAVRFALRSTGRARRPACFTAGCDCGFARSFHRPISDDVRMTSVYSRGDGVVRWRGCIVPDADCIEVTGSHVGLVANREVYRVIGRALAAPERPLGGGT